MRTVRCDPGFYSAVESATNRTPCKTCDEDEYSTTYDASVGDDARAVGWTRVGPSVRPRQNAARVSVSLRDHTCLWDRRRAAALVR
jgi:hypothetical protein